MEYSSWKLPEVENTSLNKNKLMISIIEKLKYDIENNDPLDKKAQSLVNELLFHYCCKQIKDDEI